MKVAIDIRHLCSPNPSGIGRYTIEVIQELAKQAQDIRFLLFASGSANALSYLPNFSAPNIFLTRKKTPNRLLSVYLHWPNGPSLEDFLPEQPDIWWFPNINICKTKLPYVLTVHDLSFLLYPEFFTRKDLAWYKAAKTHQLIKNAKTLLAVSNNTKKDIEHLFDISGEYIFVTPLGVAKRFNTHIEPSDKNFLLLHKISFPYFLSLCSLEPRKNIESIIEAYEIWMSSSQNLTFRTFSRKEGTNMEHCHLVIAGAYGWKSKHIFSMIEKSPYKKCIHLLNYIPEKHKPALYRQAKAFIFPSFYEGFGLPVAEALACGTKVIASFTGSVPEIASDQALYVDPYNVSDIAQAMHSVEHIQKPKSDFAKQFSWSKTAKLTLDQFHRTIKASG